MSGGSQVYWTSERILAALRAFYEREGRWPITPDMQNTTGSDLPHFSTVERRFGTLAAARRQAGMPGGGLEGRGGPGRGGGWTRGKKRDF